jgi:hypothetical protein
MDDIIAVQLTDSKGEVHFFLTWGRIFDRIDPKTIEETVLRNAPKFGISKPKAAKICDSLNQASAARYFYECFFQLSREMMPIGAKPYAVWQAKMKRQILSGKQIFYCGTEIKIA